MLDIEAYEPPPPNDWVRPVAFCTLLTIAGVGVAGWVLGPSELAVKVIMGALTIIVEIWAFNASAQWGRSLVREGVANARNYWCAVVFGCSCCSLASVYHALDVLTGGFAPATLPVYLGMTGLALMLPFAMWAIEAVERAPIRKAAKLESERPELRTPQSNERPFLRSVAGAAVLAGAVCAPAPGAHAHEPPASMHNRPAALAWRAEARALWLGGVHNKAEIARRVGQPRENVRRELAKLAA